MIDGVHHHAADMRSPASPARTSCFAARHIHVIDVTDLPNRREAVLVNSANFAGRHFDERITGLERSERRLLPSTTRNLAATARGQRSEEHTSELQSQSNLVCRLLLEKK